MGDEFEESAAVVSEYLPGGVHGLDANALEVGVVGANRSVVEGRGDQSVAVGEYAPGSSGSKDRCAGLGSQVAECGPDGGFG
ncbi:hypothetical protein C5E45_19960 [Nocardia nova]|uniref:Uncharacterized protein n=1 Tax=Nocardia nova TaxID=37330 RepID=A0A2S6AM77_9NOCA|nr:hypothetical protein C5E45_19960 [Nocardia nova]